MNRTTLILLIFLGCFHVMEVLGQQIDQQLIASLGTNVTPLNASVGEVIITTNGGLTQGFHQTGLNFLSALPPESRTPWRIYPNPIQGNHLWIESPARVSSGVRIQLYTIQGQKVLDQLTEAGSSWAIRLPDLSAGTYVVRLQAGKQVHQRLIEFRPGPR